jgi:hypothetical protein
MIITIDAGANLSTIKPKSGDEVVFNPGIHRGRLVCEVDGVTWRGEPGAILDGGYSHEWAKQSGESWRNLVYQQPTEEMETIISVKANGVTISGLTIRNSGDAGIAAGSVNGLTIRNCRIEHTYDSAIRINGGTTKATDILIEGNTCIAASVKKFDPTRTGGGPQSVSGVIKVGDAQGVQVLHNRVIGGHGEGINIGKDTSEFEVSFNFVAHTAHKRYYANHSRDGVFHHNIAVGTGHPAYLYTDNEDPAAFALVDERTRGSYPMSADIEWSNNLAVNCGIPFQLEPDDPDALFIVENNTFVWGPLTRKGLIIKAGKVKFTGNIIAAERGKPLTSGEVNPSGGNLWTVTPSAAWRDAGDVLDDAGFIGPQLPRVDYDPFGLVDAVTFDATGYATEGVFGADIAPRPPVDPPPVVDPPQEPPMTRYWRLQLSERQRVLLKAARRNVADGVPLPGMNLMQLIDRMAVILDGLSNDEVSPWE